MTDESRKAEEQMQEAKELIAFYETRGANWLNALEFTLAKASGRWSHSCWPKRRYSARKTGQSENS